MLIKSFSIVRSLTRNSSNAGYAVRTFSRKSSNNNDEGPFKVLRARRPLNGEDDTNGRLAGLDPNFELLASTNNGFPFILPGNVGVAWYNTETTAQVRHDFVMEQINNLSDATMGGSIICRVQPCPTVLRKAVSDLFPNRILDGTDLSVVTISLRPNLKQLRRNKEVETERMAQTFLITAKSVCDKLQGGGYWADFVNPFSGRPYMYPDSTDKLYESDDKFRCLDFQIYDVQDCKIVSNDGDSSSRRFVGSLFTNAPCKKNHLNEIFTQF